MGPVLRPALGPPKLDQFCHLSHDAQKVMAAMYEDYSRKKRDIEETKRNVFGNNSNYNCNSMYGTMSTNDQDGNGQSYDLKEYNVMARSTLDGTTSAYFRSTTSETSIYGTFTCQTPSRDKQSKPLSHTQNNFVARMLNFKSENCHVENENNIHNENSKDIQKVIVPSVRDLQHKTKPVQCPSVGDDKALRFNGRTDGYCLDGDETSIYSDSPPIETQDYRFLSQMQSTNETSTYSDMSSDCYQESNAGAPSISGDQLALTLMNKKSCLEVPTPSTPILFSQESVFTKPVLKPRLSNNKVVKQRQHEIEEKICWQQSFDSVAERSDSSSDVTKQQTYEAIDTETEMYTAYKISNMESMNASAWNRMEDKLPVKHNQTSLSESGSVPVTETNVTSSKEDEPDFNIGCDELAFVLDPVLVSDEESVSRTASVENTSCVRKFSHRSDAGIETSNRASEGNTGTMSDEHVMEQMDCFTVEILQSVPLIIGGGFLSHCIDVKPAAATTVTDDTLARRTLMPALTEESPYPVMNQPLYPIFSTKKGQKMIESPLMVEPPKTSKKRSSIEKGFIAPFKKKKVSASKTDVKTNRQARFICMDTVSSDVVKDILDQLLASDELVLVAVYSDKSTQLRDPLFGLENKKRNVHKGQECVEITSIALTCPKISINLSVYMFPLGREEQQQHKSLFKPFWCRLLGSSSRKIGFRVKNIIKELMRTYSFDYNNVNSNWTILDTSVAAWLLDPDNPVSTFSCLLSSLHMPEQVFSDCSLTALYEDMMLLRCAMDILFKKLTSKGLCSLFVCVETRLIPLLAAMEMRKMSVATHTLLQFSEILKLKLTKLEQEAHKAAGHPFLLSSHAQLRQVLCEELHLDRKLPQSTRLAKTSVGREMSTSETVLTQLSPFHPLPAIVLEHRQLLKLKSTYIDGLLSCVRDGGLTSHWDQVSAATGRLTSHHPNLQAIPKQPVTLRGYSPSYIPDRPDTDKVTIYPRDTFISPPGWSLLAADFQQIELRLLAHFTEDPVLLELFTDPSIPDIFNALTAQWLGKAVESVTTAEREQTKRVVYSVMYGAGKEKLAEYLKISAENAKAVIDSFLVKFPAVNMFTRTCVDFCQKNGYTSSVFQRRRLFPNINHKSPKLRAQAERQCVNFRVQGSAADLCKAAMLQVEEALVSHPLLQARLLVQIHDELLLEVMDSDVAHVAGLVREVMERQEKLCGPMLTLKVQIPVSLSVGKKWGHMEPLSG